MKNSNIKSQSTEKHFLSKKKKREYCCKAFEDALNNKQIFRSRMPDESEFFFPDGFHLHYCPHCGTFIGEGGWISTVQKRKVKYCCFKFTEAVKEKMIVRLESVCASLIAKGLILQYCPFCGKLKRREKWVAQFIQFISNSSNSGAT